MRLPAGRGLWPAFWMMPEDKQLRWPLEGEVDILEWTGNEPHRIIGAINLEIYRPVMSTVARPYVHP